MLVFVGVVCVKPWAALITNMKLNNTLQTKWTLCLSVLKRVCVLSVDVFRQSKLDLEESSRRFSRQVDDLEADKTTLQRQKSNLESDLELERKQVQGLKATVALQAGIEAELSATKVCLNGDGRQVRHPIH